MLQLPVTSYILLGLLTLRDMSGYDLKLFADRTLPYIYESPAKSQIYSELRRLEGLGLITMEAIEQASRPDKRLYSITAAGREAIEQWLVRAELERDTYKSFFLLRMFLGHLMPSTALLELLQKRKQQVEGDLQACEEKEWDLQDRLAGPISAPYLRYPLFVLEYTMARLQGELSWLNERLPQFTQQEDTGKAPPG